MTLFLLNCLLGIGRGAPLASPIRFDPLAFIHGPYTIARLTPSPSLLKKILKHFWMHLRFNDNRSLGEAYGKKMKRILFCQAYCNIDVGRVHEGIVYESNMSIESCIESNHVGLPIPPMPDWFFSRAFFMSSNWYFIKSKITTQSTQSTSGPHRFFW